MEENQLRSRAFGVTVIILLLCAVVLFSMFIFRSTEKQTSVGLNRSFDVISSSEKYGPLTYVSENGENGASQYIDQRYSYWFNSDRLLISRVALDSDGEKRALSSSEALAVAIETLDLYLEDTDFSDVGWETTVTAADSPNIPWVCTFVFTDREGVVIKRHRVEIDVFGESGYLTLSEEERSAESIRIDETEAVELAIIEISALLQEQGYVEMTPETVGQSVKSISEENILFAYQNKSIWSVKLHGIQLDDKSSVTYEVQIDAVSGEILLSEECR